MDKKIKNKNRNINKRKYYYINQSHCCVWYERKNEGPVKK
jgi:hypothetical protein